MPIHTGHVYYLTVEMKSGTTGTVEIYSYYSTEASAIRYRGPGNWERIDKVWTYSNDSPTTYLRVRLSDFTYGDSINVKNVCLFDLTAMFGAGNEPTAEEFRAMFPADYYPYSEQTLMTYSPDKVVSKGRNIIRI